jgi:hypothetical protein
MKTLPFEDMNAVFTLNTNTKGNLTKKDWETVDGKIAKAMSRKAVLFEDVYGPPPETNMDSYRIAKAYSLHPGFRAASGLIYSDNFKKYVLNSGPTYFVYNELTDSVEVFKASFDLVKDQWDVQPLMRSHRFTYEEVKYQAKSAGLNCRIFRDSTEPFYVVEMKKL